MHPNLGVNVAYCKLQVSWLLTLSGRPFQPPQQYDDPNLTCTNILSELREAGFAPASFPPTKLRQGYGDAVCSILNALCDLTLELTNFSFQAPVYLAETYVLATLPASCLNSTRPFSSLRKPACVALHVVEGLMYTNEHKCSMVRVSYGIANTAAGKQFSSFLDTDFISNLAVDHHDKFHICLAYTAGVIRPPELGAHIILLSAGSAMSSADMWKKRKSMMTLRSQSMRLKTRYNASLHLQLMQQQH